MPLSAYIMFLPLRAEDDMTVCVEKKKEELVQFVSHLRESNWSLSGCKNN